MSDCPRAGKWFRRCQFEGRYDTDQTASPPPSVEQIEAVGEAAVFSDCVERTLIAMCIGSSSKKYVRDVCVTCGRTIERA